MRAVVALFTIFIALAIATVEDKQSAENLSNGFGTDVDWVPFPEAVSTALDLDKPIFLLIHKTWCGACKALKTSLTTSSKRKEFVELSRRFVMANTEDDDEPEDEEYAPDGRYIPRLFFLDKYGKRLAVDNKKNYANNVHYFPQMPDVVKAMKLALKLYDQQAAASPDEPVKVPERVPEIKAKAVDENETMTKKDDEPIIVETPGADHLGEMHITEDQLAYMESGGCPHAAAARAAILDAEKAVEENEKTEKAKKTDDKKEKTKKSTEEKKKTEKSTDEKEKIKKTTNEKEKAKKTTNEKEKTKDKKEQKTPTTDKKAKKKPANDDKTDSKTSDKKEKKQTQKRKKEEL